MDLVPSCVNGERTKATYRSRNLIWVGSGRQIADANEIRNGADPLLKMLYDDCAACRPSCALSMYSGDPAKGHFITVTLPRDALAAMAAASARPLDPGLRLVSDEWVLLCD